MATDVTFPVDDPDALDRGLNNQAARDELIRELKRQVDDARSNLDIAQAIITTIMGPSLIMAYFWGGRRG